MPGFRSALSRIFEPFSSAFAWLYDRFGDFVKWFIRYWRRLDAWANQPLQPGRSWFWWLLAPDGYAWFVPVLAVLLVATMAFGPTFRTWPSNFEMLALGLMLLLALHAGARPIPVVQRYLLFGQLVILGILAVLVIIFSRPETYGDTSGYLRLHVGVAVTIVMIIALFAVWWFAKLLFSPGGNQTFADVLPEVELFQPTNRYDFKGKGRLVGFFSALAVVPVRYPIELLLPGSLLVLFMPDRLLARTFWIALAVTWIFLLAGILFERLTEFLKTVGRLFFIGPQRGISVVVVAVALLRLAGVHYITYLFNTGATGWGNVTIMLYVALTYVAAWFYAYWSDQFVARRLIRLLAPHYDPATPLEVEYPYSGDPNLSAVEAEGRTIALHGAGRLKIKGRYKKGYEASGEALQFLTGAEMLACFRAQIEQNHNEKDRKTRGGADDPLPSIRHLQRSAMVYPVITGLVASVLIAAPVATTFMLSVQPPELSIQKTSDAKLDPSDLLLSTGSRNSQSNGECPALGPTDPRIVVLASGGGTRSAIYAASVLRGLAEQGRICNVVLVSGVSGGSAALGYFALHQSELRKPGTMDEDAWNAFSEKMARPYIDYALDGASDLRITFGRYWWKNLACDEEKTDRQQAELTPVDGWMPARSRLGNILAESFVCEMGTGTMSQLPFGLMLNTSLLGSFETADPCKKAKEKEKERGKPLSIAEGAAVCRDDLDGSGAGGRLVLTNVDTGSSAPMNRGNSQTVAMKIVPINDGSTSIARAAALSANFPPVFPDAAIDVMFADDKNGVRYWVTDGGAVENRGAMTAYLAIRAAAKSWSEDPTGTPPPPLHIVIADVSAAPGNYSESFGLNSVLAAGGQLGLGMEGEVLADIRDIYCDLRSTVLVHDITMPPVLRNGGIGTHWLLPWSLTFAEPKAGSTDTRTLSAEAVNQLVIALHSEVQKQPKFEDQTAGDDVLLWARSDSADKKYDNDHDANWQTMLQQLAQPDLDLGCGAAKGGASYAAP